MRERYERDEEVPGRRPRDGGRRRDETEPGRAHDGKGREGRRGGYRSKADRYDEGRAGWSREQADDWGDVQIGRWAGGRRAQPTDEPGRWERDESHWGGTTGRWSRDLEREPSSTRGYGGEERRWRYGATDFDVVQVKDGEVTLEGTIDSRETKRRVEGTVDDVAGVRQVHDFLHVRTARGAQAGTAQAGTSGGRQT